MGGRTSRHKEVVHHSRHSSSSSLKNPVCALADHQPANHQELELSVTKELSTDAKMPVEHGAQPTSTDFVGARRHGTSESSNKVMFARSIEHCAQPLITEVDGARTQGELSDPNTETLVKDRERCATPNRGEIDTARTKKDSLELETVVIRAEVHAGNINGEHLVHFEDSDDFSDAGSLITQAPQPDSIHATINALSSWVSAIQPRESWYLAGWIGDSPIDFLVDSGAVVSAISLPCYEKLVEAKAILTPMRAIRMELEAANKSDMRVHGMCNLDLSVHGLLINMDTLVVDLNCHAILGMDVLGDASKLSGRRNFVWWRI